MTSSESLQHCALLLISSDMEWNHTYTGALKQLFIVDERNCDQVWQVEDLIQSKRPDVIVLVLPESAGTMSELHDVLQRHLPSIPVLVITDEDADAMIKAGADFCAGHNALLSAIKYTGMVMREQQRRAVLKQAKNNAQTLSRLNNTLYRDAPDPVCFVQDGLFMDANQAFIDAFDVESHDALNDYTLLSFTPPRSEKALKALLKMVSEKELAGSETIDIETPEGNKRQFVCTASPVSYEGEPALLLHWRSEGAGVGGVSVDKSTGLMGFAAMQHALDNDREQKKDSAKLGNWIYLWVENYREIWVQDGYDAAEILMCSVAEGVERYMPASTVVVRFNDDSLILYLQGERHAAIERVETLIKQVQEQVPENIGRMIHPSLYAAVEEVEPSSRSETMISTSFRAVRNLSISQSSERVTTGGNSKISRNDERRLVLLKTLLDEGRIQVKYQPINHLEADGKMRFSICLDVKPDSENEEDIELPALITVAERNGQGQILDELKFNTFLRDVLSFDGDQRGINGFVSIGAQALQEPKFTDWILNQLKQTGINAAQMVFEITLDCAINTFSSAKRFAGKMQQHGSCIALTELGRFDDEVTELLDRLKPNILKLDMREIDTFEDEEEEKFMNAVKTYADEHGQTIIVDHMESPAQLSRVWPYDLQLLQGDGMVMPMDNFNYDFSEPLF